MNCANHPDHERAAFCQHCGKPLCTECVRNVGTSVFCEPCLAARVAGTVPPAGYGYPGAHGYPPAGAPAGPPSTPGEPHPGLAALLGFIPGVGAMYNEQYAKGIVHLIVFAILIMLADENGIFGLFIAGWICYMAIEAYHTARARRDGTPLPNPFGLNDLSERLGFGRAWPSGVPQPPQPGAAPTPGTPTQGPGAPDPNAPPANPYTPPYSYNYSYSYVPPTAQWAVPPDASAYGVPPTPPVPPIPPTPQYPDPNLPFYHRFPSAAIWLIALGALFLIGNIPVFHMIRGRLLVPVLLIAIGVWLFVRRMISTGQGFESDGTAYYSWRLRRALNGSFWWVFIGIIWLLHALRILSLAHSWPLFLIVGGVMMFVGRAVYPGGYGYMPPPGATAPPAAPATTTDLAPVEPQAQPGSSDQEGR
jgi:hypothetical protein